MKILVTGANGFVGSELCPYLITHGHSVVPAVRRICGLPDEKVVSDEGSWSAALKGCDSVIHLAGRAHVMQQDKSDPAKDFYAANVELTLVLARRAAAAGVRRFVYMSTIKVNGEGTAPGICFGPDDVPAPQDPYAHSKLEAELGLQAIARETGMEFDYSPPDDLWATCQRQLFQSAQVGQEGLALATRRGT